jgi:hypothetical protein
MAQAGTVVVTVRADTSEFDASMARVTAAYSGLGYAVATQTAALTRLSRAMWPTLPLWKRVWLTLQRKGW